MGRLRLALLTLLLCLPLASGASSPLKVTLTAYSAHAGQTDSTPELSACGRTRPGQVAVSRDLFRVKYHCGQRVRVFRPDTQRWHTYTVFDTMNRRYSRRVDILMPTRSGALRFGVRFGLIE